MGVTRDGSALAADRGTDVTGEDGQTRDASPRIEPAASRTDPSAQRNGQGAPQVAPPAERASASKRAQRLVSLDAFRGLAILGMLLVNEKVFGPATPLQLKHARWNQSPHVADMVFPWFLLIVGVAIPYAAASRQSRGVSRAAYYLDVVRRAVILVLLGCAINSSWADRPLLNMGVLQLIGLAYLVAAILYGLPLKPRLAVAAFLLAAHWAAIRFIPIPGVGAGIFTADQNLIKYLHEAYLGHSLAGIIGVVPTSALVLIGTALGDVLRRDSYAPARKAVILLAAGALLVLAGWLWHFDLRFNKPYWTASFILFSAGWGSLTLGALFFIIDIKGWRAWAFPLVVAGMNAIFIYVVPILVKIHVLKEWMWPPAGRSVTVEHALQNSLFAHLGRVPGGFVYTFGYIVSWWLVVLWLYRKGIFYRV
jgi:predicted acyltransferase